MGSKPRSQAFAPGREPFTSHSSLALDDTRVTGPFPFLNPTRAHFQHTSHATQKPTYGTRFHWTSRNNRKGRHALIVAKEESQKRAVHEVPPSSSSVREVLRGVGRCFTKYPYWDISWLVAYIFTWGSIIWVFNAFFVWLPLQDPGAEFANEILTGGGITAFIGATVFEVGSFLLFFEAVNENRKGCFGWAVEQLVEEVEGKGNGRVSIRPATEECGHHHRNKKNLVGKADSMADETMKGKEAGTKSWVWWPSWHELTTHYFREIGFLASFSQLIGATIFWIAGFTALPGILNHLSEGLEDGIYWTPQVVGGSGFIISGFLFMLETQKKWYIPAFNVLGWHIGFWNFIGGIGFTLSPAFGYDTRSWAQYQAALSTFWASWAFLIGSGIQLYESLDKHPVDYKQLDSVEKADGSPA